MVGPYTGTKDGVKLKPKDTRPKRAQPCEDMQFLGLRQREICNQVTSHTCSLLLSSVEVMTGSNTAVNVSGRVYHRCDK
mgnify:CR=1 FL=1